MKKRLLPLWKKSVTPPRKWRKTKENGATQTDCTVSYIGLSFRAPLRCGFFFCGNISLFSVEFLSLASAYAVDVAFEVAVIYQLRQNILFKGRHGAGVKTELFVK